MLLFAQSESMAKMLWAYKLPQTNPTHHAIVVCIVKTTIYTDK